MLKYSVFLVSISVMLIVFCFVEEVYSNFSLVWQLHPVWQYNDLEWLVQAWDWAIFSTFIGFSNIFHILAIFFLFLCQHFSYFIQKRAFAYRTFWQRLLPSNKTAMMVGNFFLELFSSKFLFKLVLKHLGLIYKILLQIVHYFRYLIFCYSLSSIMADFCILPEHSIKFSNKNSALRALRSLLTLGPSNVYIIAMALLSIQHYVKAGKRWYEIQLMLIKGNDPKN